MATTKPTSRQLNIPDIASAIVATPAALATFDAEYARIDNSNSAFFPLSGGELSGDIVINDASGNNPLVAFERSGTNVGTITGVSNRLLFEFGSTDLSVYGNVIVASTSIRAEYESHDDALIPRKHLYDNFVSLSGTQTISGNITFSNNVSINGNLSVSGTTTSVNSTNLEITDNIIMVNAGQSGAGVSLGTAGIEVERGTLTNQLMVFDEATDKWKMGTSTQLVEVASITQVNAKENAFGKNSAFNKNFGSSAGTVCEGDDSRLNNARTPTAHTHTIANVTGLGDALDDKENAFGKNSAFNKNFGSGAGTVCEGDDSRLSNSRAPTAHTHTIANITSLQTSLNAKENAFGKNDAFNKSFGTTAGTVCEGDDFRLSNSRAPTAHTHTIANITSLQASLNAKENSFVKNDAFNKDFGTTAGSVCEGDDSRLNNARTPTAHTHTIADITSLQTTLNGKAASSHSHSISNITNLQTSLNAKENAFGKNDAFNKDFGTTAGSVCEGDDYRLSNSRSPTAHTHTIANITSLQTTLNGKAASSHSHSISNITNLQTTLDGKAASSHNHNASNITAGSMANARIPQSNVTQHQAAIRITKSQITDFGDYATNALANTKISQSGGWMYGDLSMRLPTSGSSDTENGILFSEHSGNGAGAFGEVMGERVGSELRAIFGSKTGSVRNSHIAVTSGRVSVNADTDMYVNLNDNLSVIFSTANTTITKMSMRAPTSSGNCEIELVSGTTFAARIAVSASQTQSYTMVLPTNRPTANQVLTCGSTSGQFAFMIWATP